MHGSSQEPAWHEHIWEMDTAMAPGTQWSATHQRHGTQDPRRHFTDTAFSKPQVQPSLEQVEPRSSRFQNHTWEQAIETLGWGMGLDILLCVLLFC